MDDDRAELFISLIKMDIDKTTEIYFLDKVLMDEDFGYDGGSNLI